jgi:hypothetical protein
MCAWGFRGVGPCFAVYVPVLNMRHVSKPRDIPTMTRGMLR